MRLLIECQDDIEYITEEKNGKKHLYLEGIFMQSDLANKNKRIYPTSIMMNEVNRYIKDVIKQNNAVGELSHPSTPSINLERVSHKITELKMNGSNVIGKALVLETPMGNIARGLIEGGVRLGVSSRGVGSLKPIKDGLMEVGPDFRLVTVDIVSDPSAPEAWVNAVMEGAEWIYEGGDWKRQEVVHETREICRKLSKRELQEAQGRLFQNYLRLLERKEGYFDAALRNRREAGERNRNANSRVEAETGNSTAKERAAREAEETDKRAERRAKGLDYFLHRRHKK